MRRFVALILMAVVAANTGCTTIHNGPSVPKVIEAKYNELTGVENTRPPSLVYFIDMPDDIETFRSASSASQKPVTVMTNGGEDLATLLYLLQRQTGAVIVSSPDVSRIAVHDLSFTETPLWKVLKYLKIRYDIGFTYHKESGILEVKDYMVKQLMVPPIMNSPTTAMGNDDTTNIKAEPTDLEKVISSAAEALGVKILSYSNTTGMFHVTGKPSKVEDFCKLVEQEATERLKFVIIHIMILELRIDNRFDRRFDLKSIPELTMLGKDVFGTFRFAPPPTNIFEGTPEALPLRGNGSIAVPNPSMSLGAANADTNKFSALMTLLERWGTTEVMTAPAVMTANGLPVSFNFTNEVGYWQPGELNRDTTAGTLAGGSTVSYTEGRPTFEQLDPVGLKLKIRPKLIRDQRTGSQLVELDISLSTSQVFEIAKTTWQRSPDVTPTLLERPLRQEKIITSRAMLHGDELLLLAKLDEKNNLSTKSGFPWVIGASNPVSTVLNGEGQRVNESTTFIVISALMPSDDDSPKVPKLSKKTQLSPTVQVDESSVEPKVTVAFPPADAAPELMNPDTKVPKLPAAEVEAKKPSRPVPTVQPPQDDGQRRPAFSEPSSTLQQLQSLIVEEQAAVLTADRAFGDIQQQVLSNPARLVLDIADAKVGFSERAFPATGGVMQLRIGEHAGKIRLVLDSENQEFPEFRLTKSGKQLKIAWIKPPLPAATSAAPAPAPDHSVAASPVEASAAVTSTSPAPATGSSTTAVLATTAPSASAEPVEASFAGLKDTRSAADRLASREPTTTSSAIAPTTVNSSPTPSSAVAAEVRVSLPASPVVAAATPVVAAVTPPTATPAPMSSAPKAASTQRRERFCYVLRDGDTIEQVAAAYGVDSQYVLDENALTSASQLHVGQLLCFEAVVRSR